jgi:CHAT domain-containing protein
MEYYLYCLQVIEESEEYDLNLKARVYSEVGNSYTTLNKYQVAIKYHQKALEIAEKSEEHGLKEMCYSGLGLSYFALSDYQTAIDYYQKALQVDSIMGMPTPLTKMTPYSGLGIAYHSLGEHQTASQMYQSALDMAFLPASPSSKATLLFPQIALHTAQGLGNIAFTQGDWKSAIEAYEISVFATEHLRAVSLTDQRRQKVVEESFSVYANLIHAYVQVGEYGKAIETADRSRAKHLVDLMHSSDLYKDGNVPETVRQLLAEYEAIQQELDQRRQQDSPRDLGFMGRSPQFSVEVLAQQDQRNREKIIELEQRKQYLYEQIRQADPVLAGQIQVDPLSIQQMRQLLTSSTTALVNIHTTSTDTYIFILTQKGDPQVFTCTGQGGTNLQAWLEREWLLPYLNIKQSQSLQEAQQKRQAWIDKMPDFLQELAEKLQLSTLINEEVFQNIDELIIVPHLLLHFIPFAALPVNNGQTQYLGERFTLRIIPSARILDYCHQRSVTPHSQTINYHPLPLLSQPNLPSTMGTVEDATSDLPFASFLGDELAKLLNISSDRRLRQQQATPDEYRELLDQVQGIHHYHHASYQLENPLDSALALADGNRLTLGQLLTPSWQMPGMPNIFLAACETQVGEINLTDDIISLGAGFLIAGARNVISTLWSVDQLGTAVFCLLFYENVQQGMNRALALQTAQKQMREMSGREFNQRYGKRIKRYLKEQESALTDQHDQCEQQWQEASGDLKEKLEQEKMQLSQRIIQCRDNYGFVREREREEAPFSHPYYWSAFISQGLA